MGDFITKHASNRWLKQLLAKKGNAISLLDVIRDKRIEAIVLESKIKL
jgi:hypothetical protein